MTRTTIACKNCRYDKNKVHYAEPNWTMLDIPVVSKRLIELEQRLMLIGFCSLFPLTNKMNHNERM